MNFLNKTILKNNTFLQILMHVHHLFVEFNRGKNKQTPKQNRDIPVDPLALLCCNSLTS